MPIRSNFFIHLTRAAYISVQQHGVKGAWLVPERSLIGTQKAINGGETNGWISFGMKGEVIENLKGSEVYVAVQCVPSGFDSEIRVAVSDVRGQSQIPDCVGEQSLSRGQMRIDMLTNDQTIRNTIKFARSSFNLFHFARLHIKHFPKLSLLRFVK